MSTYLVAFVVSEFVSNKDPEDLVFNVWARREAKLQTNFAQKIGPEILKYFGNYTQINYYDILDDEEGSALMSKMDLIAFLDLTFDAMENWGCLTYRYVPNLINNNFLTVS